MINSVLKYLWNADKKYADKTALVMGDRCVSYGKLKQDVLRVASWIIKEIGCQQKPIIVLMKNTPEAIISFLGIACSGNIYVPIASDIPMERLHAIYKIVDPICIIDTVGVDEYQSLFECQYIVYDKHKWVEIDATLCERAKQSIIDTDPLYILFTSGSTGIPKGVVVSHRAVIDFTEEASETMDFSDKEIFLNQAPFYFDASVPDIYCTIRNGATLHMVDKILYAFPIKLMEYIEEHHINAIYWVPSALVTVANLKALGKKDISSLKKVMFCGEVMPTKQYNMWKAILPQAVFVNYYGPCETTYASTYYIINREFRDDEPLPIGVAANNTRILLIDENKKLISESGKQGEIYIQGTGLALGYYNNPIKTRESFVQNPVNNKWEDKVYRTGDLAHYNEAWEIIYDGRCDSQIKHMGYRIELGEIENVAGSLPDITRAACFYDEMKDHIICCYTGKKDAKWVEAELKKYLPQYMIPNQIINLKRFPMNSNDKIDRIRLKQDYMEGAFM